ncbi:MAG: N-acetylmuramoyl-L-alanine amidase [Firmicutes bacterium]|nr:N-acetylmuramoyl-L-alanine amidase [Bacillota bacterium]
MLPATKKLINYNYSSRKGQKIEYIVIHDTGNTKRGAGSEAHFKYFNSGNREASAHYFVDDNKILQLVEDYNSSWNCGDGRGKYGITNRNSIGVEICINEDSDYEKAVRNTLNLVKYLMEKYNISIERVVRHFDASKKICPRSMSYSNWAKWYEFKESLMELSEEKFNKTLKILQKNGIINSPNYWAENAKEGKFVKGEYAAILIKRVADYLIK